MAGTERETKANDSARSSPSRGIECPRCGCQHLPVVYTRHRERRILRVRECRHCGRRIPTWEKVIGRG